RFNITERTVFRIINQLKEMGFPIYFNKEKQSYCYEQEGKLTFKFEPKAADKEVIKLNKNWGGNDSLSFFYTDILCQWLALGL
ncbi:MAG: hypothetical protein JW857_10495, partial [Bacteroidales bacterium]|nr:hypothetical protein [Bacteroidales bacterium]